MDYLQSILDNALKNKYLFGLSLNVSENKNNWSGGCGNLQTGKPYFIASTTKLFTSSLIFKLREDGKLKFSDTLSTLLSDSDLENIHVYKGKDYSNQINITNLLAHTSGLPDYFKNESIGDKTLEKYLTDGNDIGWDFQNVLEWSKKMTPKFEPSKSGKAHYSDTNYQILGKIIENKFEDKLSSIIQVHICNPLGLDQTYLYADPMDTKPCNIYFKSSELKIPKAMSSFGADGGIVSTSKDMMKFIKAFMSGELFPKSYLVEIQKWNKIFFPLESGIGIQRFKAPWYFSPFKKIPELIGHSGLSGAFAYYAPEVNTYLTGTVNQIHNPGNSFKLMLKVLMEIKKKSKDQ